MVKHVKGHDKDKYYHLAKDQGYRARSAFKLIQINKRFEFLQSARVCIDLCAAPGGWCQVATQLMPKGSLVLGVDLLPIRTIRGVKTLVNDITTAECRRNVAAELNGWKADVVLCDGAPDIGSAYHKDAFVQNELVLAALKTATDHLIKGGTFCTKVYRSTDYNVLLWVFQQLFEDVQAMKPNSSRSQSSEIFIVCLKYTKPDKIDPKLLDPNHIFKQVEDPGHAKVDVLHKKYEKMNKRHRTGYDWEGGLLTSEFSISGFIAHNEPVRVLTDYNALKFSTEECEKYRTNQYTTEILLENFNDLRVLGKVDFKKILKWRTRMRDWDTMMAADKIADGADALKEKKAPEPEKEETEETIYEEIMELRAKAAQEERRAKKKTKAGEAKERQRQRLGMSANAFDGAQEDMDLFSFSKSGGKGRQLVEDALEDYGDDAVAESSEEEEELVPTIPGKRRLGGAIFVEDNLQEELEADYVNHQKTRKTKSGVMSRGNKLEAADDEMLANKLLEERGRDDHAFKKDSDGRKRHEKEEQEAYRALLNKGSKPETGSLRQGRKAKKGTARSDSDSSSDDSEEDEPEKKGKRKAAKKPLAATAKRARAASDSESSSDAQEEEEEDSEDSAVEETIDDDVDRILKGRQGSARNDQWFSHPIFKQTLVEEEASGSGSSDDSGRGESDSDMSVDNGTHGARRLETKKAEKAGRITKAAQEMIDLMPMTDKQKRSEKRKKETARAERKKARHDVPTSEAEQMGFEIKKKVTTNNTHHGDSDDDDEAAAMRKNPEIQMGMGKMKKQNDASGFQIVPREDDFASMRSDPNKYDSDDENYTAKEKAEQLALGTLMLRRSRKKALVDASYNRFTWNDSKDLPSWFVDDERQHNKPQIPIPPALLEQIKSKFQMTGTKSIKKVEEAKMRKKKFAKSKLAAAKKSANSLAENSEMSEKQKLRAVQKAMKTSKVDRPSKVYVVSKRSSAGSTATKMGQGKGMLKFVDKRMRADTRGEKAAEKRRKKGRKK